jgi:hypothetical protein
MQHSLPILSGRLLRAEQGGHEKHEEKDPNSKWHEAAIILRCRLVWQENVYLSQRVVRPASSQAHELWASPRERSNALGANARSLIFIRMNRQTDPEGVFSKTRKRTNSLLWLFEPLEPDPRFVCQKFFFFDAAYLEGRLYLALVDREEPWNGLMVCTSREHHASLQADFSQLIPHSVLGKWLYLSQFHPDFESVAPELIMLAKKRDRRLGVEAEKRKRPASKITRKRLS